MKGNWEQRAEVALKWVVIPLMLFGIGLMVIGPRLGGDKSSGPSGSAGTTEPALVNQQPIEPGARKWIPVSPPQVNVSISRRVVEEDPVPPVEEFPPTEPPTDGTVDDGSVGGMKPPVGKTGGDATTGGTTSGDGGEKTTGSAFKGIGGRG